MERKTAILAGVVAAAAGSSMWASTTGFGVPQPEKQPISIREESARGDRSDGRRTRYFMGGGIFYGK